MTRISPNLVIGGAVCTALGLAAVAGLFWTPFDPLAIDYLHRLAPPDAVHLFGTDEFGRDIFSRLLAGASTSARISVLTVVGAVSLGTILGLLGGYLGGWVDRVIMSFVNALLSFPGILLALGLVAVFGANQYGIVLALGFAYTPSVTRIVRSNVISIREQEFILASRTMGNSEAYTVLRHVLPNCLAPLIVLATSMFGWALLAESALSFLGLGVPPPAPTWGNMLATARPFLTQSAWLAIFPGLCISIALLGINLLGDALRDKLDPRMRGAA
jgi:peptide/nickel transport system permease protein